jgi:hypothetical protein
VLAEDYVNTQLEKFGITMTAQEVEAEIEAAVSQEFNNPPKQTVVVTPAAPVAGATVG